jgi:hypothetical protein
MSRLQAGHPGSALASIETGLRLDPADPEYSKLLQQMFSDARRNAAAAHARAQSVIGTQPDRLQAFDGLSAMMTKAGATSSVEELPAAIRTLWTTEAAFRNFEGSPSRR